MMLLIRRQLNEALYIEFLRAFDRFLSCAEQPESTVGTSCMQLICEERKRSRSDPNELLRGRIESEKPKPLPSGFDVWICG